MDYIPFSTGDFALRLTDGCRGGQISSRARAKDGLEASAFAYDVGMHRREALRLSLAALTLPALPRSQNWAVFDAHQAATASALAERIIPGAKDAQVDRYMDLFLAAGAATERGAFLDGMGWLDAYATRKYEAPFVDCAAAQQTAILEALSLGDGDLAPGKRFFDQAKLLTARIYWSTEAGYRELNAGDRIPATFACEHPER